MTARWEFCKRLNIYIIGSLVVAFASVIVAQEDDTNLENELAALNAVSESANQFSSSFFKYVVEENSGNLISSPLSAAVVLAMAGYGAGGETENQFKEVLHLPTPDSLAHTGYQKLIDTLNNITVNKLFLANKVFVNEKYPVKPTYKELTETYFRSTTQLVDFKKNKEVANMINAWVEQNTNNRIKDLISASDLNDATDMVLVNAIYFKAEWQDKFNTWFTKNMTFYVSNDTAKNVSTMSRRGAYKYAEIPDMDAKFVEIPYKGGELSMVIIVPNEIDGLSKLEAKLENTSLTSILQRGQVGDVRLYLPKFKVETQMNLNHVLKKMGLIDAFEARANFSGISNGPLMISDVVQKVFIEVNEIGTEAAAATRARSTPYSKTVYKHPPYVFEVDRSLYYAICHNDNHLPLFSGFIVDP